VRGFGLGAVDVAELGERVEAPQVSPQAGAVGAAGAFSCDGEQSVA
jgi:hypothetical protein